MTAARMVICFAASHISECKRLRVAIKAFLNRFAVDRLPVGAALALQMGGFAFMVEGYDSDPRELYAIPAVRRFYAAFHRAWPYWLYFCDLNQDSLKTMVMCSLPSLTAIARDGRRWN